MMLQLDVGEDEVDVEEEERSRACQKQERPTERTRHLNNEWVIKCTWIFKHK